MRCRAIATLLVLGLGGALAACGDGAPGASPAADGGSRYEVEVTGKRYEWHVRYPGADGRLGTADDLRGRRDLVVPEHVPVTVHLRSADYIYVMRFPHLGLQEAAVPDLEFRMDLPAAAPGEHALRGDQMCGFAHERLIGRLRVVARSDLRAEQAGVPRE